MGSRLRARRRERGLSQRELAERAGVSLNCISLIERDEISPNVATLRRLASALNVKMSYFFEAGDHANVLHVIEAADRLGLSQPTYDSQAAHGTGYKVSLEDVCSSLGEQAIQPCALTLKPHASAGGYAAQTGHGFVYCLRGSLKCDLDNESYLLEPGEALLFEGTGPHRCENPGETEAHFVLVLQPPEGA